MIYLKEDQICAANVSHWKTSAAGDLQAEHNIYADGSICDYPNPMKRS
jgi:hypothetical protein